jgi:hypothetical protein
MNKKFVYQVGNNNNNSDQVGSFSYLGTNVNGSNTYRFSWLGHIHRMPESSIVKKIYKWKPLTSRPVGSPKSRWEDGVRIDLKKMKLLKWKEQVQDRLKWKFIINPLNAELNPICHLLAVLGAHHIFHVSKIRVKKAKTLPEL